MIFEELQEIVEQLKSEEVFRSLKDFQFVQGGFFVRGRFYEDFVSNDYLGLSQSHSPVEVGGEHQASSSASRLISGNHFYHSEIEERMISLKRGESALIYGSGYMANVGIISALCDKSWVILMDKRCHASIIDGVFLSKAKWRTYRSDRLEELERLLEQYKKHKVMVVTESVFSMDGDLSPVERINELVKRYDALFYVDESHATGVLGENSSGLTRSIAGERQVVVMSTFGKALGSYGACFTGSRLIREYLVNKSRTLIYSTALPPIVLKQTRDHLDYLLKHPEAGGELMKNVSHFVSQLKKRGIAFEGGESPIISIIKPGNSKVVDFSKRLLSMGFFLYPIRYPTVPKEKERVRICVHRSHKRESLDRLVEALSEC